MRRRNFLKNVGILGVSTALIGPRVKGSVIEKGEILYNGIQLPKTWPPKDLRLNAYAPMEVPYLEAPPRVIPIDVGRQLFVDDFLISYNTLVRTFHQPQEYAHNPIFVPKTPFEKGRDKNDISGVSPRDGGIWWDPKDQVFKMWYNSGNNFMSFAISSDGINWERPELDVVPGTNKILPQVKFSSNTVFIDPFTTNEDARFKMFMTEPWQARGQGGHCFISSDGIHWNKIADTGPCGDRSTLFYNPFRKKWIFSLRSGPSLGLSTNGRSRFYVEKAEFGNEVNWTADDAVVWTSADYLDKPDPIIGNKPELYNLSANAYESLMVGFFEILLGPGNSTCKKYGTPKITDLKIAFSRDGFHWDRSNRAPFLASSRTKETWNRGYVQPVGGICNIVGDELWFYHIGTKGDSPKEGRFGMYNNVSMGVAKMRRDGFASMDADRNGGILITNLVKFSGKHLFVNVKTAYDGELKVAILNEYNEVISPYTKDKCVAISADSTIHQVAWEGVGNLSNLANKVVKFRFHLHRGSLYSFWVSPDETGASYGYNAGGGPGFTGSIDEVGKKTDNKKA